MIEWQDVKKQCRLSPFFKFHSSSSSSSTTPSPSASAPPMSTKGSEGSVVYSRRPKKLGPVVKGDTVADPADDITERDDGTNRRIRRRQQSSWIERSLSSRGRRSSAASVTKPEYAGQLKQRVFSPNVRQKKRVGAPANFLQEQKSYFEEVDAFELQEESPSSEAKGSSKYQPFDADLADVQLFHCCHSLEVVEEDTSGELLHETPKDEFSTNRDPLSAILKTPCFCSKNGFQGSTRRYSVSESVGSGGLVHCSEFTEEVCSSLNFPKKEKDLKISHTPSLPDFTGNVAESLLDFEFAECLKSGIHKRIVKSELHMNVLQDSEDDKSDRTETEVIVISSSDNKEAESSITVEAPDVKCRKSHSSKYKKPDKTGPEIVVINGSDKETESSITVEAPDVKCRKSLELNKSKQDHYKEAKYHAEACLGDLRLSSSHIEKQCLRVVEDNKLQVEESQSLQGSLLLQENADLLPIFDSLLQECGQVRPVTLYEAISTFCNVKDVVKIGEGTFGEAFRGNDCVFKIVPMGGDFLVNGENQKTCAEIYSETFLMLILNRLRGNHLEYVKQDNICRNFIETKGIQVCQGRYDPTLVHAWEVWDAEHTSENQHPQIFPEKQLFVVYVLADGGSDLERFVLATFNEARSLLLQVTLALAVAEAACEFEHRDLHWGNIVITRQRDSELHYKLHGKDIHIKNHGVFAQLIDFTLARIYTGKQVLFCDLSADPVLFEGPVGNVQIKTYRRMLKLTKGQWETRFFKTNCYWIHYLADILMHKKAFPCSQREKRALRGFRKRVLLYDSAEAVLCDGFFDGIWVGKVCQGIS